jgi:hypothetical protein
MKGGRSGRPEERSAPVAQAPKMQRQHAQEVDLRALRAVTRASAQGREEGRREAARELAESGERRARRARSVLIFSVVTALLLGLSVGLALGTRAPRPDRNMDSHGAHR